MFGDPAVIHYRVGVRQGEYLYPGLAEFAQTAQPLHGDAHEEAVESLGQLQVVGAGTREAQKLEEFAGVEASRLYTEEGLLLTVKAEDTVGIGHAESLQGLNRLITSEINDDTPEVEDDVTHGSKLCFRMRNGGHCGLIAESHN